MLLQLPGDLVHVGLHLGVLGLHGLQLATRLFEEAEEPLLLLFLAEALQLHHQLAEGLAHLSQVLGAHRVQGVLRKAGHVLLGRRAVLQDQVGVRQVDLLGKRLHRLFLRVVQQVLVQPHRRRLRLGGLRCGGGGRCRVQSQLGHRIRPAGIQGQFRHHALLVCHCVILHHSIIHSLPFSSFRRASPAARTPQTA